MRDQLISIISIGAMLIGVLFSLFLPKGDRRHDRALTVFVFGATILLANWLFRNPNILAHVEYRLGWILLSIVFVFIQIIKRR